jgi:hypothetical protein
MSKEHNSIDVTCKEELVDAAIAEIFLSPSVVSGRIIKGRYNHNEKININAVIDELNKQNAIMKKGDLSRPEDMLLAQAHALDNLFGELVERSRVNMGEYFNAAEKYLRLALKAQGQCRTTIEALADIKNPKPYIQNNRAQYQQVNNGNVKSQDKSEQYARAEKKIKNELLEGKINEQQWMDTRAPQTASENDKELEAVGAQHRRKD